MDGAARDTAPRSKALALSASVAQRPGTSTPSTYAGVQYHATGVRRYTATGVARTTGSSARTAFLGTLRANGSQPHATFSFRPLLFAAWASRSFRLRKLMPLPIAPR